jgi:hypothetical protein
VHPSREHRNIFCCFVIYAFLGGAYLNPSISNNPCVFLQPLSSNRNIQFISTTFTKCTLCCSFLPFRSPAAANQCLQPISHEDPLCSPSRHQLKVEGNKHATRLFCWLCFCQLVSCDLRSNDARNVNRIWSKLFLFCNLR